MTLYALNLYTPSTVEELEEALDQVAEKLAEKLWEIDEWETIHAILEADEALFRDEDGNGFGQSKVKAWLLEELVKKGDIAQLRRIAEECDDALEAQEDEAEDDDEADSDSESE